MANDQLNEEIQRMNRIKSGKDYNLPVLVIDDDQWTRKVLVRFLNDMGYKTFEAEDPYKGISMAIKARPIAVFLDIYLPDINGDKILKILKEIEITSDTPIIMISGNFSKELLHDTYKIGAAGFISKPFQRDVVEEALNKCFRSVKKSNGNTPEWEKEL